MPEMVREKLHRKLSLNQKENNSAKFNLPTRERHREIERQRDRETERGRETETEKQRERDRQTDRQTDRQRERQRERERVRERQRDRETKRQRQRQRVGTPANTAMPKENILRKGICIVSFSFIRKFGNLLFIILSLVLDHQRQMKKKKRENIPLLKSNVNTKHVI